MRPPRARAWDRAIIATAVGALAAAAVLTAGQARADVVDDYVAQNARTVCAVLDNYPSVAGIEGIGMAIIDDGWSPQFAGQVITLAVIGTCPEYLGTLQSFIDKWTTGQQVIA